MNKRVIGAILAGGLGVATLGVGTASADPPEEHRACPEGWGYQFALGPDDPYDKNDDGIICVKPVEGNGNSGQRAGTEEVGHVPGHNHKDNNQPGPLFS